ncbi:MAG: hypothetical protein ACI4V5_07910 [Prevotella sp.]
MKDFYWLIDNEALFGRWYEFLIRHSRLCDNVFLAASFWQERKNSALRIIDSKHPYLIYLQETKKKQMSYYGKELDLCRAVTATMVALYADKNEVQKIINDARQCLEFIDICEGLNSQEFFDSLCEDLVKGEIEKDWDYSKADGGLGGQQADGAPADGTPADIKGYENKIREQAERITELERRIAEMESEAEDLKEPAAADGAEPVAVEPHNKVRLELVRKLFECAGADFEERGVKAAAARLAQYITQLPIDGCRQYMSYGDLNVNVHKEEVENANKELRRLNLKFVL